MSKADIRKIIGNGVYKAENNDMIILKDIEFTSLCEHHLTPFSGKCHVGYIPNGKIIGFGKIQKIVRFYADKYQLQERITNHLAETIRETLNPKGVAVVIEAKHSCMEQNGKNENSKAITSCMLGRLGKDQQKRDEFLAIINRTDTSNADNDKIIIKDLVAEAKVGVDKEERGKKQRLLIDAELYLNLRKAGKKDELKFTVNYDDVILDIKKILKNREYKLLESAAEDISRNLFKDSRISGIKIKVKKPKGIYIKDAAYTAVEIQRSNGEAAAK